MRDADTSRLGGLLIHSKLERPPLAAGLVSRPRLLEQRATGPAGPLTLIVAPAGYGKTTAAWFERMMAHGEEFRSIAGEHTFRAWQVYLGPLSTGFRSGQLHVYRVYCRAV